MFLTKIMVINMYFILGYFMKKIKILKEEDGNTLLRMAFYIFLPAILFQSIRKIDFTPGYLAYPLVILVMYLFIAIMVLTYLKIKKTEKDTMKIVAGYFSMANIGFLYPFYIAIFGEENVWRLGLLDFGNSIFVYAVSYAYIVGAERKRDLAKKVFTAPGIIALALALACNFAGIKFFTPVEDFLNQLGNLTGFSMLFSLGLFFNFRLGELKESIKIVFAKEILKFIILLIIYNLNIEFYIKSAFMLIIVSPVASSLLNFSLFARLDTKFVSKLISISMLISFIEIPIVVYFLQKLQY
ncbi:auxin efflux carrier [Sebaldella termitidis]|uniref:Auxin Efflux Carrier n=1 Tax=Sebaldella termitidis (strain ATCC 33386 / NCTC 11300) TaxID=526218 RepID=D1AJI9_SEBTE|nr:AEC family transporter [Sebaldella termitidis]ACZ08877.1 Auxin Efflux Carrier [Sebaldella termitidis ATCC 33386]SUI24197.1 auxin efflux carrier [Sebaldella termitidis]